MPVDGDSLEEEEVSPLPSTASQKHIGNRRRDCWWEPIHDPEFKIDPEPYDWDLARDAGPYRRFVPATTLLARIGRGDTLYVRHITFLECDFQGEFVGDPLIMFEHCRFEGCDLAYSTWRRCHFKDCTFDRCSLSLASFDASELRSCTWNDIGLGSRTELTRTFLSNPDDLIRATVSRTNPQVPGRRHRMNQWFRLRGTRAHFLRNVMLSHATTGDEHTYYRTVRLHELRRCSGRIAHDTFDLIFGKRWTRVRAAAAMFLHTFNYLITALLGALNGWGESAGRPFLVLIGCWAAFGLLYSHLPFATPIIAPFQKSFDITMLVGYTNQTAACDRALTLAQDLHALLAIVVYTVFFATVISKVSRAR